MKDESLPIAFETIQPSTTQQSSSPKIDAEMNTVDLLAHT